MKERQSGYGDGLDGGAEGKGGRRRSVVEKKKMEGLPGTDQKEGES